MHSVDRTVLCGREQAQNDASSWRQKYDAAAAAAESEEADEASSKKKKQMMTARMTEYETQLASAVAKTAALEKIRNQLQFDAETLTVQLEKVDVHCGVKACKANRNFFFKSLHFEFRVTTRQTKYTYILLRRNKKHVLILNTYIV